MTLFDTCIITASNTSQAQAFRKLLDRRISHGLYPREIDFQVVADPEAGRVGSGGGTLWALSQLSERRGPSGDERILIIHAGGESRRLPVYAPEGKLFAPLPVASSSVLPPTVLDVQLGLFLRYPWLPGEVLVASGDVMVDFDTESMVRPDTGVSGHAVAASFEEGEKHGVFRFDGQRAQVLDYYQKQPTQFLREHARIEGTDECALDMGLISMRREYVDALIAFGASKYEGSTILERLGDGRLAFDIYLEMLTASLPQLSFDEYLDRVGGRSRLSPVELRGCYDAFHPFPLGGVLARGAQFVHFGSLDQFPSACRELAEKRVRPFYAEANPELHPFVTAGSVSYDSRDCELPTAGHGAVPALVESAANADLSAAAGGTLIVGVDHWPSRVAIPAGICVERRILADDSVTLVYTSTDSFRPQPSLDELAYCGWPMSRWLGERGLSADQVFVDEPDASSGGPYDLLQARLFPTDTDPVFLSGYWQVPEDTAAWRSRFLAGRRYSIAEANATTDVAERERRRVALRAHELRRRILSGIGWREISINDFLELFPPGTPVEQVAKLRALFDATDDPALRVYRRSHLARLDDAVAGETSGTLLFVPPRALARPLRRGVKQDQIVWARSPVRFDLAGGWTDTPPYTNRRGGTVTNIAANLNGQPPIQVFVRPTTERHVRIHSIDLGLTETVTSIDGIQDFRNPASPFALPKAALCLLGLVGQEESDGPIAPRLEQIGSGIEITLLSAVPKGSGLGTSSILGGVILAALQRFFALPTSLDDLYLQVLEMEQMLTTGGGWQDQIGGLAGGVKFIESRHGLKPAPIVYQLDPWLFENAAPTSCMTLFYTGVTRLAKNILQEVVDRVNDNTPAYIFTHDYLKELAAKARVAVARRELSGVADVISGSWYANKLIHPSTTNDEVEAIISATRPHFRGMKLLGAGGGGFALFVSESPEDADRLREILHSRFEDDRARIVGFSLNKVGLEVTVS